MSFNKEQLLRLHSESITLLPTERLLLHNMNNLYYVENGVVDLFLLEASEKCQFLGTAKNIEKSINKQIASEALEGPLSFMFDAKKGDLLFPFPIVNGMKIYRVLAIAVGPATLRVWNIDYIEAHKIPLNEQDDYTYSWLIKASDVAFSPIRRKADYYLKPNELISFEKNSTAEFPRTTAKNQLKSKILWLKVTEGQLYLEGLHSDPISPLSPPFPMAPTMWVNSRCATQAKVEESMQWEEVEYWKGMELFNGVFLSKLINSREKQLLDEQILFAAQGKNEEEILDNSMQALANFLSSEAWEKEGVIPRQPFLKAYYFIAQRLKLPTPKFKGIMPRLKSDDQVEDFLNDLQIPYRKVFLEKHWWNKDAGPLLVRNRSDSGPAFAALLPNDLLGYELQEEADTNPKVMTTAIAEKIAPFAFMFYRYVADDLPINIKNFFLYFFSGHKFDLIVAIVAALAAVGVALFVPIATALIFDYALPNSDSSLLGQIVIGLIIAAFCGAIFAAARDIAIARLESFGFLSVQSAIWQRLLRLPFSFFRELSMGNILKRADDINNARNSIEGHLAREFLNGFFSIFFLILMFIFSGTLAMVIIPFIALSSLFCIMIYLSMIKFVSQFQEKGSLLFGHTVQLIAGVMTIRSHAAEKRIYGHWLAQFVDLKKIFVAYNKKGIIPALINKLYPFLAFFLIVGTLLLMHELNPEIPLHMQISLGSFIAFYLSFSAFYRSFLNFQNSISLSLMTVSTLKRSKLVFETPVEQSRSIPKHHIDDFTGKMHIENLYFRYGKDLPYVHKGISLYANPGEFIAIVGASGSGKSSLVQLLLGFEKADQGAVYYDEKNIEELDLFHLREKIGAVMQNSSILHGTLRENITGGRTATDDEVMLAIHLAAFEADLAEMPMGLKTPLISGGMGLSGGQKQRIYLARAFLGNPKLLILDEATNALDNVTQGVIVNNLNNSLITRIVIAHRLSTIRKADRIYVIEKGKIVQSGTFDELLKQKGYFSTLTAKEKHRSNPEG